MEKKRLLLDAFLAGRDSTGQKDGSLRNLYKELTSIGPMIVKRPGLGTFNSNVGTGQDGTAGQGIVQYNNGIGGSTGVFAVIGDTLFQVV